MKKKFVAAIAAVAALALTGFTACGTNETDYQEKQAQDVYAISAVSSIKLLIAQFSKPTTLPSFNFAVASASLDENNSEEAIDHADKFDEYLGMMDTFFGDEIIQTTAVENEDEDYADYAIKLEITGQHVDGTTANYALYYNESLQLSTIYSGKSKEILGLDGVMNMDSVEFRLRGERTNPADKAESGEIVLRAYPYQDDDDDYIEVKHEYADKVDERDTDYIYSLVENGKTTDKTSLKLPDTEKGERAFTLTFLSDEEKESYLIQKSTAKSGASLSVNYTIGTEVGEFTIVQTDDAYEYTFADNTQLTYYHD
jgi:hypothetical protein